MSTDKTTHFGAQTIPEQEKAGKVRDLFSDVANKYDIMNDVMSVGIHRIWKEAMMDWLAPRAGQKLLDVAGGTGDVSFKFLKRAGHGHATVCDLTEGMLIEGRKRAEADQMADSLDWVVGDAMDLPFEDNSFDVYTISFGIRNVTRPQEALNEAYRVRTPQHLAADPHRRDAGTRRRDEHRAGCVRGVQTPALCRPCVGPAVQVSGVQGRSRHASRHPRADGAGSGLHQIRAGAVDAP